MLTPDKIKEKSFQTTGRGSYRAEDVDIFLDDVVASYEQMFKENGDLIKKISILAKKIEEYRADEESLKLALLNAQKLADRIVNEAKETAKSELDSIKDTADKLRSDSETESKKMLADAEAESQKIKNETEAAAAEMTAKAQRESTAIVDSAKAEAEKILADAVSQSNEILGNINRKVTHESLVYDMIQKEASEFKSKLVAMYRDHISLINQLPEIADKKIDEAEAEPETEVIEETAEAEEAEVYTDEAPEVPAAFVEEVSEEAAEEETEPEAEPEPDDEPEEEVKLELEEKSEMEDISSSTVYGSEEDSKDDDSAEKIKPFKLDFSKINFDEDESDLVAPPAPTPDFASEEDEGDDGASSISFKSFFKKK